MKTTREDRRLSRKIHRLIKKNNRLRRKLAEQLADAHQTVICGIQTQIEGELYVAGYTLAKINDETGELHDFLMYFPDYNDIALTRKCLEAYLLTNREHLDECLVNDINRLLARYQ